VIHKFQINLECQGWTKQDHETKKAVYILIFLLLMMQDGKVLPDGPVVISPDGLFPSLYREGN